MNRAMVATELAAIRDAGDFSAASEDLVNGWSAAGAGIETVEPILRFLESNPNSTSVRLAPSFTSSNGSTATATNRCSSLPLRGGRRRTRCGC